MDTDSHPVENLAGPSTQTIVTATFLVCALIAGIFAYYLIGSGTSPERECVYRGGAWTKEGGCIFESADGTAQVGMQVASLTLTVPEGGGMATFVEVEIGSSAGTHSSTFAQKDGMQDGSVALLHEFGRVEKVSGDLVVPFAVTYGGTGVFTYLGVFEKTTQGYVHRDSLLVGDRIGVEGLSLGMSSGDGALGYFAKLLYRDREVGETMADVPRDPRTLEATIYNHVFDRSFVLSRDGLLYNDVLKVKAPALNGIVASPLIIRGEARGWYFEGSFPVTLVDWDGKIIAEGSAQAQGDWMTTEFVPFTVEFDFVVPKDIPNRRATLIFRKDNPSGLPENDDAFEIPVTLK